MELTEFVANRLAAVADPAKAAPMAKYMKTDMPFYGVQKPARRPIWKALVKQYPPADRDAYEANVLALWALPHREEKYAAIHYARAFPDHCTLASLPLYERMIREGAWWDLVDGIAPYLVGALLPHVDLRAWARDDDLWIRRSALIAQLNKKEDTDADLLFELCLARAHETEFFIRKAIGWALRQYARTDADAVRAFLAEHGEALSGLSRREASKHL